MKYTKEIPTKPGWYWVRERDEFAICELKDEDGIIFYDGSFKFKPHEDFEYAGPIEEPEE